MKRVVLIGAACIALTACSSTSTQQLLTNLQGCERHYDGAISGGMTGGSFSGTIKVDCKPPLGAQSPPVEPTSPPGGT